MRRRAFGRPVRVSFAAVVALLIAAFALACGDETPAPAPAPGESPAATVPEPAPAEEMPTPAGEMPAPEAGEPAPSTEAGEGVVTEAVVPENYPSDVPVYPGAEPGSALTMPGLGVFATFESDESIDAILAYYRDELSKNGWSVAEAAAGGIDATKEGRAVQVRARADENGRSQIAINIEEKT